MKFFTKTTLAGVLAIGLSAGVAGTAFASNGHGRGPVHESSDKTSHTLGKGSGPHNPADPAHAKDRCLKGIDRDVRELNNWALRINNSTKLTPLQKSTIVGYITPVSTALTTVARPAVVAAVTPDEVKAACLAVVTDYRVKKVVRPQVTLTTAADLDLNRLAVLQTTSVTLAGLGKDVTVLNQKIADALALVTPVPSAMAALTPAGYNAAPVATDQQIRQYRHDLEHARRLIRQAEHLAHNLAL